MISSMTGHMEMKKRTSSIEQQRACNSEKIFHVKTQLQHFDDQQTIPNSNFTFLTHPAPFIILHTMIV
jgi:hypothetical protein